MTDRNRRSFRPLLLALIVILGFFQTARAAERVVIGVSPALSAASTVIALQQGYFTQQGIDADIHVIESGNKAVVMMLAGELDLSESTLFALVSSSFSRDDFKILTQVSTTGNSNMIIARKERGIRKLDDLRGKKIGVLKGGFPRYVLDMMLLQVGLDQNKVKLVFDEIDHICQMLIAGEIDAACIYGIWVDKATQALKDKAVVFHDDKIIHVTIVHAGRTALFERHPQRATRLLRAYVLAEDYAKKNPDEAFKIVTDYLKLDKERARKAWKPDLIHIGLDNSLIMDMEAMARWQIDVGLQNNRKIPNYLNFIQYRNLSDIDPKRVNITR